MLPLGAFARTFGEPDAPRTGWVFSISLHSSAPYDTVTPHDQFSCLK